PFTTLTPLTMPGAVPVFVTVTGCGGLVLSPSRAGNTSGVGANVSVVLRAMPVPATPTVVGPFLPCWVWVMTTTADREPTAPGVNVTRIEQDSPGASVFGSPGTHSPLRPKSPGFVPDTVTSVIVSLDGPVFVQVVVPVAGASPSTTGPRGNDGGVHRSVPPTS